MLSGWTFWIRIRRPWPAARGTKSSRVERHYEHSRRDHTPSPLPLSSFADSFCCVYNTRQPATVCRPSSSLQPRGISAVVKWVVVKVREVADATALFLLWKLPSSNGSIVYLLDGQIVHFLTWRETTPNDIHLIPPLLVSTVSVPLLFGSLVLQVPATTYVHFTVMRTRATG